MKIESVGSPTTSKTTKATPQLRTTKEKGVATTTNTGMFRNNKQGLSKPIPKIA